MSDLLLGTIFGAVLVALVLSGAVLVLTRLGLIYLGYGKGPLPAPSAPVEPPRPHARIGCSITVEEKAKLVAGKKPQMRLFAIVDNEGDLVIRSLKGFWRVVTPDSQKHPAIRIQRDVLAPQDKYLESYLLSDDLEMQGESMRFDVEVEFDYLALSDEESRHYSGKYRYDRKTHRVIKIN